MECIYLFFCIIPYTVLGNWFLYRQVVRLLRDTNCIFKCICWLSSVLNSVSLSQYHSTSAPYSSSSTCNSYQKGKWAKLRIFQKPMSFQKWGSTGYKSTFPFLIRKKTHFYPSMVITFRRTPPRCVIRTLPVLILPQNCYLCFAPSQSAVLFKQRNLLLLSRILTILIPTLLLPSALQAACTRTFR
jgi:hypothetical protein